MGTTSYSISDREHRSASMGYATADVNTIFQQNNQRKIHESMNPMGVKLREARDSSTHPNTVPIILALDVTGSMGKIPHYLVKEGLPHIMGNIIQNGVPDPALLFLAVGDTSCDSCPLQVGQFESGDEELDTWLTRSYLEGGGGGNEGESYLLAWYFASNHTVTDAWEKRKQKGFLFTTGDEPCLKILPQNVIKGLIGDTPQASFSDKELLAAAQEKWNVYHLHILQGNAGERSLGYWKELLGENCIAIKDYENMSKVIAEIVVANKQTKSVAKSTFESKADDSKKEEIFL